MSVWNGYDQTRLCVGKKRGSGDEGRSQGGERESSGGIAPSFRSEGPL